MKIIKNLTFTTLVALAATLLFQTTVTRAGDHGQKGDHGQRGDDNERGDHDQRINNPFVILLDGIYKPVAVGDGPKHNLGLTTVNLSDGSYSKVKIYPVSGFPGDKDEDKAIGTFYVQFVGGLCAYDLPGGSFSAKFVGSDTVVIPDGEGGIYINGTYELDILEATGIYRPFASGHIHMVDILHLTAAGFFDEYCFCHVSH